MKKTAVILAHALIGWVLCAAIMGIGPSNLGMSTTLKVHAVVAPIIFGFISRFYFQRFAYTNPLQTAVIFTLFIMAMDYFLVAVVILKSLAMFRSLIGTWIPFGLIFLSTYLTGMGYYARKGSKKTKTTK